MKWAKTNRGFTIVELLIVVVVIAILASVTVVAYSGVKNKTDDTVTINAVNEWAKLLVMYATETGEYPFTGSKTQTQPYASDNDTISRNYPCLGLYPGNVCANTNNSGVIGTGHTFVDTDFNTLLTQKYGKAIPQPSTKDIAINGEPHRGAFFSIVSYATGAAPAGSGPNIVFFVSAATCPTTVAGYTVSRSTSASGGSRCNFALPDFRR